MTANQIPDNPAINLEDIFEGATFRVYKENGSYLYRFRNQVEEGIYQTLVIPETAVGESYNTEMTAEEFIDLVAVNKFEFLSV